MAAPMEQHMVLPVCAVLHRPGADMGFVLELLERFFGARHHAGPVHAFEWTDYYEKEMGSGLRRFLVCFETLMDAPQLVEAKWYCSLMERLTSDQRHRRTVNLDPGYIDEHHLVLASFKAGPAKLYLDRGVWADPVLSYAKGRFSAPGRACFRDFSSGVYSKELLGFRNLFKLLRRTASGSTGAP